VALSAVIAQGVLGGMRVIFNERTLAMIHGCTGPAFFGFTAALAAVSSRRWRETLAIDRNGSSLALLVMTIATPALAYVQIILGAQVRHIAPDAAPRMFQILVVFHIAVGLALAIQIVATALVLFRLPLRVRPLATLSVCLCGLVAVQLALGCTTWIVKYGWPAFLADSAGAAAFTIEAQSWWQAQITTAHVAVGSLIFAVSTVQAIFGVRIVGAGVQSRWKSAIGQVETVPAGKLAMSSQRSALAEAAG
jgi:cytochrome c oxidase assembly protein subunit 15